MRKIVFALLLLLANAGFAQAQFTPGVAATANPYATAPSTYGDPRNYAAPGQTVCGKSVFTNDATLDDAPAIQRALNVNYTVLIPIGCKFVTSIHFVTNGQRLFGYGSGSNYTSPTSMQPGDIYVPDAAASQMTSNCAIDTKGFDGVLMDHFGFYGQWAGDGTVAFCNSVGIANGAAQAFAHFDHIDVFNMGNGIGTAMSTGGSFSGCDPTGFLGNPVFQFRASHLTFGNDCSGITANYSDVHIQDIFCGNIQGACINSPANGDGIGSTFIDGRCEFNFASFDLIRDGACIYVDGKFNSFSHWIIDHPFGQCASFGVGDDGTNSSFTTLIDWQCQSSNQGAQFSEITNVCNYVFQSAVDISAYSMRMSNDPAALHGLCFVGGASFTLHWDQPENDVGAGWSGTFLSGTFPLGSMFYVNSQAYILNDRTPWSAVLQAQPTTLNGSNLPLDITSLPISCSSTTQGQEYTVTNATAPTIGSAVVGGGSAWAKIDCNGSAWNVSAK